MSTTRCGRGPPVWADGPRVSRRPDAAGHPNETGIPERNAAPPVAPPAGGPGRGLHQPVQPVMEPSGSQLSGLLPVTGVSSSATMALLPVS
jgi:hypothetical protein